MEKFLRSWRQDALNRGQHDAAIYIGDKALALTNSDSDAFWLAQVHFNNNNYARALALLLRRDLIARSTSCKYLAAHCYIKQNKFDQALSVLGEHNPTHLISSASNSRRKLHHLNGHSHVTLRNGRIASSRPDRLDRSEEREREDANNIRFEAAMCYLRGLCYAKQNAFDRARDCYKDAVRIDVQCFEAFDQLMKNSLMSPAEELEFLESLDFDSISVPSDPSVSQEAAHFAKILYTTRLSKYSSPSTLSDATETLSTHYNLADNPDILLSRAEALYTQCRFREALELTSSILSSSDSSSALSSQGMQGRNLGHSPAVYPLHLACLYETGATNALFLLAHTLADNAPEESYTYLAIGVYYLSVSKVAESRRFFSKASLLDPHSAPAWIGFAHTFAAEGEHDQAIAAYSTAARLFQGSHLPQLFLGMQHLALNNMSLAHEYLCAAYTMSSGSSTGSLPALPSDGSNRHPSLGGDPLVLNELGVVLYHQSHLEAAAEFFRQSLALAASLRCDPGAWVATRANLGHALRRIGRLDEALAEFDECLRVGAGGAGPVYGSTLGGSTTTSAGVGGYEDRGLMGSLQTSRGLVLLELGRTMEAVTVLHEAVRVLGVSGGDAAGGAGVAGTLLSRALEIWAVEGRNKLAQVEKSGVDRGKGKSVAKTKDKGKQTLHGGMTPNQRQYSEGTWTDDIADVDSVATVEDSETMEEKVEMELDEEADGLLHRALSHVRPRKITKRPGLGIEVSREMDVERFESPADGPLRGSRSTTNRPSPSRRGPGRGRQGDIN